MEISDDTYSPNMFTVSNGDGVTFWEFGVWYPRTLPKSIICGISASTVLSCGAFPMPAPSTKRKPLTGGGAAKKGIFTAII